MDPDALGLLRPATFESCWRAVLGLHTTEFIYIARAMYQRMGFVRAPQFDFRPVPELLVAAYRLNL